MKNNWIVGFLWSPAQFSWDQILEFIREENPIEEYSIYKFGDDKESFKQCVLDIYKTDDISPVKIEDVKLKCMKEFSNEFLMFYVKIDDLKNRKKEKTGTDISTVVERIKKRVRTKFKKDVSNYVHDIIIHIADNIQQTVEINKYLLKYKKFEAITFIRLKTLLQHQFVRGQFNRVDVLVRHYSIKQYMQNEDYDFALYKKMQNLRVGKFSTEEFKNLIKSFLQKGFDLRFPISINSQKYSMMDGSHRVSIAYYLNLEMVPVNIIKSREGRLYGINWIRNTDFEQSEMIIIENELENLMNFIENETLADRSFISCVKKRIYSCFWYATKSSDSYGTNR